MKKTSLPLLLFVPGRQKKEDNFFNPSKTLQQLTQSWLKNVCLGSKFAPINLDCGISPNVKHWPTSFVDKVLDYSNFSRDQVNLIYGRYQTYHTSGTSCN